MPGADDSSKADDPNDQQPNAKDDESPAGVSEEADPMTITNAMIASDRQLRSSKVCGPWSAPILNGVGVGPSCPECRERRPGRADCPAPLIPGSAQARRSGAPKIWGKCALSFALTMESVSRKPGILK